MLVLARSVCYLFQKVILVYIWFDKTKNNVHCDFITFLLLQEHFPHLLCLRRVHPVLPSIDNFLRPASAISLNLV